MSHFTEIKTQIKDIEALRSECQEMGLTLLQNAWRGAAVDEKVRPSPQTHSHKSALAICTRF